MNNKLIAGIAIVVVVVLALVLMGGRSDDATVSESISPTVSPEASVSVSASPTTSPQPGSPTKTPGSVSLSYQQALTKYANTRLQFDSSCQVRPANMTVKNGTSLMLDNRSATARIISIGAAKYSVAGYGFRIVAPTSKTLPSELLIDCGASQNVGKILLQK